MHKLITSPQNPAIRSLLQLQEKSRVRRKEGRFVIEGRRELELAVKGGFQILDIFFVKDMIPENEVMQFASQEVTFTEISAEVYARVAYRGSTEGILGVAAVRDHSLARLDLDTEQALVLVAEAPEKPGNIGALLRTADAAGVDAVIIADPRTDLFNPNIIRSSVGGIFTRPVATGSTSEVIAFLKAHHIRIYGAALQAAVSYDRIDLTGASAIVVGTEATGLSESWIQAADQNILIPMQGVIDSMNVSVAAGILMFEARRQRGPLLPPYNSGGHRNS